ncbi:MAG: InlB B-repeat-containing protein [Coriobacteriia bacterium]|nr:InlB B-repeat-containing protein [Coriobacteriia bacterium]
MDELHCDNNKLTSLDLSNNPNLTYLYCGDNNLTSLDIENNQILGEVSLVVEPQEYNIKVDKDTRKFDLSSLPGKFDFSRTNINSWEVEGDSEDKYLNVSETTLTFDPSTPDDSVVQYQYDADTTRDGFAFAVKLNVEFVEKVAVSFDANGGSGEMPDVKVEEGSDYALPECSFVAPAGKEFKAWEVAGEEKAPGATITVNEKTTVKAVWKDKPQEQASDIHILTFNFPGYELVINGITYKDQAKIPVKDGVKVRMPEGPKRPGYEFAYWEGSKYYAGQEYEFTGDHDLKAVWKVADESAIKRPSSDRYARDDFYTEGAQQQVVKAKPSALPKTGDASSNFAMYSILAASGLLALVALSKPLRKRNQA